MMAHFSGEKNEKNNTQEELIKRKLKLNCDVAECAKLHTIRIEAAFCDQTNG